MHYPYIIARNSAVGDLPTLEKYMNFFPEYDCLGVFDLDVGIMETIITLKPRVVFIYKNTADENSDLPLQIIKDAVHYLSPFPYFIIISDTDKYALQAVQSGISDYLIKVNIHTIGECLSKFKRKNPDNLFQSICIKSYSDYQFVKFNEVIYLKADNNSTDFKLTCGKTVTAFKTLKHFEHKCPDHFVRIHKSYIVNIYQVSRIHLSKSRCYLNYNEQIPFSEKYRKRIEQIIDHYLIR